MTPKFRALALTAALAATAGLACDDTTGTAGDASVRVLLTDAPAEYIAKAWVDIGAVELIGGENGPVTLSTDGTDGLIDLLELRDAATMTLADADIEPGTYHQIRLIVEDARVQLADGYAFNDGSTEKDLFIPSGAQTGIKLNIGVADGEDEDGSGLEIVDQMVLVLDFDVNQSFVIQGNPNTPAGIMGVLFKPTLRVTANDVAASISGTVATDLELSVEDLVVSAEPVEGDLLDEFQTGTATAVTGDNGTYTVRFLVPGTYRVTVAAPEGYEADPTEISVTVEASGSAEGVDFEIVEPAGDS